MKYEATPSDNSFDRARESEKVSNDHLIVVLVSTKSTESSCGALRFLYMLVHVDFPALVSLCSWSREVNFWWSSVVWRQNTDASSLENWRFCKISPKVSTSFSVFCSSNNLWLCCVLLRVHVVLSPCDRYVAVWCRILSQSFFYDSFKV